MAKLLNNNDVMGLVGTASTNYIQKISDGTTEHDLAVVNGITFFNGKQDTEGVVWDGVQPLEVVIPTLSDIVSNPVVLKGIVNSASDIPSSASNGDLLYIGTSGSYFTPAVPCEAGDMAIYYNSAWHVISGEEQITINAAAATASGNDYEFSISGTPKTILTVEGKTVSLVLDYADIRSKMAVEKNAKIDLALKSATVTVSGMTIALSKDVDTTDDISTSVSFNTATALSSGVVTISDKVLVANDFTWDAGSLPTVNKNAAAVSVTVNHNLSISKAGEDGSTGDYLTSVSAIKSAVLSDAQAAEAQITYATGLAAASGKEFVTNVHVFDSTEDAGKAVAFTIPGAITAASANNTFVTGLESSNAAGDNALVSSISVGAVTANTSGSDFVRGLSDGSNVVLTSVSFGDVAQDATRQWFLTGVVASGADVVTDVTIGEISLVADNSSTFASTAIISATVSDHVLSFNTASFMKPVSISKAADTITKGGFSKGGVILSGYDSTPASLTMGGISQADTTVSYKSLATGEVTLTQGAGTDYVFDVDEEHAYTANLGYKKITVTDATFTKNTPALANTTITATIPADTFVESLTGAALPSFSVGSATGEISGSVDTTLSMSEVSFLGVNPDKKNIPVIGAYSLTSDSSATGAITVAAASTYNVENGEVTIASGAFVTAVEVDSTAVQTKTNA